jgi:hypothetical protein
MPQERTHHAEPPVPLDQDAGSKRRAHTRARKPRALTPRSNASPQCDTPSRSLPKAHILAYDAVPRYGVKMLRVDLMPPAIPVVVDDHNIDFHRSRACAEQLSGLSCLRCSPEPWRY